MSELKPCPFCGGEAQVQHQSRELYGDVVDWYGVYCRKQFCGFVSGQSTEAEAIAAWNTRAAVEFDNWFYLPKPKEPIAEVGETLFAWDGANLRTDIFYQVQRKAVINWAKELDEHIIKRVCEVWGNKPTCHDTGENEFHFICSACKYEQSGYEQWNYCPNCGAKVVK